MPVKALRYLLWFLATLALGLIAHWLVGWPEGDLMDVLRQSALLGAAIITAIVVSEKQAENGSAHG